MSKRIRCSEKSEYVAIGDIIVGKRGRKDMGDIVALMKSIDEFGLGHPIVVKSRPDGKVDLAAGERRYRACLLLCATEVPVTRMDHWTPLEQQGFELEENLQRKQMDWTEEIACKRTLDDLKKKQLGAGGPGLSGGWTTGQTAKLIGEDASTVGKQIAFAKKLEEHPELLAATKGLPLKVAMKVVDQLEKSQEAKRKVSAGEVVLNASLELGSCLELIKKIPDSSVNLVITDPPFGIEELQDRKGEDRAGTLSYTAVLKEADNLSSKDAMDIWSKLCPELYRTMAPSSHLYVFFAMDHYAEVMIALLGSGFEVDPVPLIWDKGRSTAPFTGLKYQPCYEPLLFATKGPRTRRLAKPSTSLLRFSPDHANKKSHPFQKPQELLRFLVEQSSFLGELVLDPFAGSGSTLKAAFSLGRRALGFELDAEHYDKAQAELMTETKLQGVELPPTLGDLDGLKPKTGVCIACEGSGKNSRGGTCLACGGKINA